MWVLALVHAGCSAPATPQEAPPPATPITPSSPVLPAPPSATTPPTPPPLETPQPPPTTPHQQSVVGTPVSPTQDLLPEYLADAQPPSRFQLAAYRDGELDMQLLGDQPFVSGGGGLAHLDASGDRLVHVEYGMSGLSDPTWLFDEWTTRLAGVWPDNAWLTTEYRLSRSHAPPHVQRREDNAWKLVDTRAGLLVWSYAPIIRWHAGQVLGLRTYQPDPALFEEDDELPPRVQRKLTAAIAKAQPALFVLGPRPTPAAMVLPAGLSPGSMMAAPTGELFMLMHTGDDPRSESRVQRWGLTGESAITGTTDILPGQLRCDGLAVRAADDAYILCTAGDRPGVHLLRFDGATWSEEPTPADALAAHSLSIAPDGGLALLLTLRADGPRSIAQRRARGAAWEVFAAPTVRFPDRGAPEWVLDHNAREFKLQLPDPAAAAAHWIVTPKQVLARANGELWLLGSTMLARVSVASYMTERTVVMRTGTVQEPLRMLPDGDLVAELFDWRAAPAWTPKGCRDDDDSKYERAAFVPLRTLPRDAPRNAPEPTLEAFVTENTALMAQVDRVVEVYRRGRRTTGLYVFPKDQAGADALLAALERTVPGEKRAIECRLPRIRREFDRATGRALQEPAL